MKKLNLILCVLFISLMSCKKDTKKSTETKDALDNKPFVITNGRQCFKSVVKNKVQKDGKEIVENNVLEVLLTIDNENVQGEYNYYPFEDKENKGSFVGTMNANIATTICEFTRNKKSVKEEVVFKIEKNNISILGGEKEEVDGVWKFKNKEKGFFMNEIPRIDCVN